MGLSSSAIGCLLMSTLVLLCISKSHAQNDQVFDIINFGGKSDGKTNNGQALSMAWDEGCGYNGSAVVLIPQGTFLIFPLKLEGPCHGSTKLQINGNVLAPNDKCFIQGEYWLAICQVNNFDRRWPRVVRWSRLFCLGL
ncbi:unnamed protein product [Citrullus colocynthis]|uniref:Polygalacturonase n=1 Tax=Citrullus colocynthis TaxID=252529 RepID=A0ABP0YC14_9ROSI